MQQQDITRKTHRIKFNIVMGLLGLCCALSPFILYPTFKLVAASFDPAQYVTEASVDASTSDTALFPVAENHQTLPLSIIDIALPLVTVNDLTWLAPIRAR
ncbi:MAG: hypothetical protein CL610_19215 [Anaerolineaceae bacterium]|nr:hypothetical protein [Anaerolineaceae bacterium]